jgi:hypothetical protein
MTKYPHTTYVYCNSDNTKDYKARRKRSWLGMSGSLLSKTTGIDLLPLAYWKHPKLSKQSFFGGLLVVRDAGSNCFRRVGYFRSNDMDFKKMPTKPENLFFFMQENDNIVLI